MPNRLTQALPISLMLVRLAPICYFILLIRRALIAQSSITQLITILPDDAFYYLKLACNFAETGFWSFDGYNPTSGFHIVYAYLLAAFIKILSCANLQALYLVIALLGCLSLSYSYRIISSFVFYRYGLKYALLSCIPFWSTPITSQSTAMMESWLTILISSILVIQTFNACEDISNYRKPPSFRTSLTLTCLSFLAILIRSDLLVLILSLSLICFTSLDSHFFTDFKANRFLPFLRNLFSFPILTPLLVGAATGSTISASHSFLLTGSFLQNSAVIKKHWGMIMGFQLEVPVRLLSSMLLPMRISIQYLNRMILLGMLVFFAIYVIHSICYFLAISKITFPVYRSDPIMLMPASLLIYLLLYSINSQALQQWYSAQLIIPTSFTILTILLRTDHFLDESYTLLTSKIKLSYHSALFILLALWISMLLIWPVKPLYPNQLAIYKAVTSLSDAKYTQTIGSWNAGIPGYFYRSTLINLDGLVNSKVVRYIISNTLNNYLAESYPKIDFVLDYRYMTNHPSLKQRGGYPKGLESLDQDCKLIAKSLTNSSYDICLWTVKHEHQ